MVETVEKPQNAFLFVGKAVFCVYKAEVVRITDDIIYRYFKKARQLNKLFDRRLGV